MATGGEAGWVIPAIIGAYNHREQIQSVIGRFGHWLARVQSHVMFTGMTGTGKTVLYDYLCGNGFQMGYVPPGRSVHPEDSKKPLAGQKTALSVIPGQHNADTSADTEELIEKYGCPEGIVHVVSFGYHTERTPAAKQGLVEEGIDTIQKYRDSSLEAELDDLDHLEQLLHRLHDEFHRPRWLIVAATKADLYADRIGDAEQYYDPAGSSNFVQRMKRMCQDLGERYFYWEACAVCSFLEDFDFNDQTEPTTLKVSQRDQMVNRFLQFLEGHL